VTVAIGVEVKYVLVKILISMPVLYNDRTSNMTTAILPSKSERGDLAIWLREYDASAEANGWNACRCQNQAVFSFPSGWSRLFHWKSVKRLLLLRYRVSFGRVRFHITDDTNDYMSIAYIMQKNAWALANARGQNLAILSPTRMCNRYFIKDVISLWPLIHKHFICM
jgi:hypothetical protein